MVKTIKLSDDIYKRLRKFGFVGQSFNDVVEDLIDYAEEDKKDFDKFLDVQHADEEDE